MEWRGLRQGRWCRKGGHKVPAEALIKCQMEWGSTRSHGTMRKLLTCAVLQRRLWVGSLHPHSRAVMTHGKKAVNGDYYCYFLHTSRMKSKLNKSKPGNVEQRRPGKTKDVWMKYRLQVIIQYWYRFINCDKCTTLMKETDDQGDGVYGTGEPSVPPSTMAFFSVNLKLNVYLSKDITFEREKVIPGGWGRKKGLLIS